MSFAPRLCRLGCASLALTSALACSSRAADDTQTTMAPPEDAALSEAPAPEENPITLTLHPFLEIPIDESGFGEPVPLDGVEVCVIRRRGHGESWGKFVDIEPRCTTAVAEENVVLPDVPAMSELLVTAEKEGYVPRVIPVITGQWDLNAVTPQDVYAMHLFSREGFSRFVPDADPSRGVLVVLPIFLDLTLDADNRIVGTTVTLGGVTATLDPTAGGGPFYFRGGILDPGAVATVAGTLPPFNQTSGLVFTNLPQAEYAIAVSENAPSTVFLRSPAALFGYPDRLGVIRTPVLDGYYSLAVAESRCDSWLVPLRTCAPSPLEGGPP